MMLFTRVPIAAVLALASNIVAQNITIPATNGSLPAGGSNGCAAGYSPGNNTLIYTIPYPLPRVLSIIGNYTNLTWAGSPDNSVATNASSQALSNNSWAPGDARTYQLLGATLIETILTYDKPADGPYVEIHTLAPLTLALPGGNVSTYAAYDGQRWESTCDGRATLVNFTADFCATNATVAAGVYDQAHLSSAITVGKFLGGMNFTTCEALASMNGTNGTGATNGSSSTNGSGSTNSSGGSGSSSGGSSGASWVTFSWATMGIAGALAVLIAMV